jgi:hypothetical protein
MMTRPSIRHGPYSAVDVAPVHLRVSLAQGTGDENPYIDPKDVLRLLIVGDSASGCRWSALRVVKSCRKDCPTAKMLPEAKAAALHLKRYQSSLSTKRGGEAGEKMSRKSAIIVGQGTIPEPSTPHIGKGAALVA